MELKDRVLDVFKALNQVPRGSKHEEKVSLWLEERAKAHGFDVDRDAANNILVRVPATAGYENSPIIILQGHMDMVCEKAPDSNHNFETDPIEVIVDGDWIHANNTTLGGDDGLGVATALAIAEDPSVEHPALELLFTTDEEQGMTGAEAFDASKLKGRILLNLDSEDEGVFTIGCAGGQETVSTLPLNSAPIPAGFRAVKVVITGLLGGHSGCEIHCGRASSIKLSTRIISKILAVAADAMIVDIKAGSAHNAIPCYSEFTLAVSGKDTAAVVDIINDMGAKFTAEYKKTDPNIKVTTSVEDVYGNAWCNESLRKMCDLLFVYPHGVQAMSQDVAGLVETSNNLANIRIVDNNLRILSSQRSSVLSKLNAITSRVEACVRLAGGTPVSNGGYPSWQPNIDSELVKRCIATYKTRFGKEPKIDIIHAGLECGILGARVDGMDMVSTGPTIIDIHTPKERASIESMGRCAQFCVDLLKSYK